DTGKTKSALSEARKLVHCVPRPPLTEAQQHNSFANIAGMRHADAFILLQELLAPELRDRLLPLVGEGVRHNLQVRKPTATAYLQKVLDEMVPPAAYALAFALEWRTSNVVGLARAIYRELAFDRMSILADALMDAGCADEQILGHCRGEATHVRGCWLLDLIL